MRRVASLLFGRPLSGVDVNNLRLQNSKLDAQVKLLTQERDALSLEKNEIQARRHMERIIHHSPWRLAGVPGVTHLAFDMHGSRNLVERIVKAYKAAVQTPVGSNESIWLNEFAKANTDTHDILMREDLSAVSNLLKNPASSMLFYGFDNLQSQSTPTGNPQPWWLKWNHQLAYDGLLQLARAIGVRCVENPEANLDFTDEPDVEQLLRQIDDRIGVRVDFPNLYEGEVGLQTSRGVANIRAVYAIYQAWRTASLVSHKSNARVLEIGAGLGRAGYYSIKLGVKSYTIIDIPLTGVSQGYHLGSLLGEHAVSLWQEESAAPVRVLPPVAYESLKESFDLIVNVDSLTEMAKPTAESYILGASRLAPKFLSINHEHNSFTVESIYRNMSNVTTWRTPCWVRRGYVEELIDLSEIPAH